MAKPILIKKYGNRRLYDTEESRYLTLDELAEKIKGGTDVQVVEVKTGADLTQVTLTQIVIEGRGAAKFLPVGLLTQMIRLGDDALAEFLGSYMTTTMEIYLRTMRGMRAISPFSHMPMAGQVRDTLSRFFGMPMGNSWPQSPYVDPNEAPPPSSDELASLRQELEELKAAVAKGNDD